MKARERFHAYQFLIYKGEEEELWNKFVEVANDNYIKNRSALLIAMKLFIDKYEDRE